MAYHCSLISIVSGEEVKSESYWGSLVSDVFFLAAFKIFLPVFGFWHFFMVCLFVDLFPCILLGISWVCCICSGFFPQEIWGVFSHYSQMLFSASFSLPSSSSISIMCTPMHLTVSHIFLRVCLLLFPLHYLVAQSLWIYLHIHTFFLLPVQIYCGALLGNFLFQLPSFKF